ncbi:PaaI family thioesterase [Neptunicoccus cionae]|uniref:PaaI family thioesterase n=1 Tax=Neptunicoccus cionae TaxID=2035344 RepID=UPI000C792A83|nr:PaaI family thioesterase [Amylibacter cionae]PLS21991.1 hypothetical protein C0U40_05995 [Amylibacter cionae]
MTDHSPLNPDYKIDVARSFAKQGMMETLNAELTEVSAGTVTITAPIGPQTSQQDGFAHAGLLWTVGDSAAGYATLSLMGAEERVLTVEMKINLLSPAVGDTITAVGRVIRFGRNLCTSAAEIYTHGPNGKKHVATMIGTTTRLRPDG